jgi:hypothetical protein
VTVRRANGTQRRTNGGSAVRRSDAGHAGTSRPMRRDNHNVIQRKARPGGLVRGAADCRQISIGAFGSEIRCRAG